LALLFLLPAAWALRKESLWRDGLAGSCLALAAWVKIYPAIFLLGLVPLRRLRAFWCGGLAALGLGILQAPRLAEFLDSAQELIAVHAPYQSGHLSTTMHTL